MTEERPDGAHEPDQTGGPDSGSDGLEARPASAPDARFPGLRSAADIFGAPRKPDEWPSRRERREAERAAAETGAPLPEPFVPDEQAPVPPAPDAESPVADAASPRPDAQSSRPDAQSSRPDATTPPASMPAPPPARPTPQDDGATQAISMPEELAAPSRPAPPTSDPDRSLLGSRIPPASAVPPNSTAPHPSSIQLPTAQAHRDQRAAETRAIEDERRRLDPRGEGRDDVDWLGRATGSTPTRNDAAPSQPVGVEGVLPSSTEPPSFTDLLRVQGGDLQGRPAPARPFDWAVHDDETGEVPTTLTSDSFDTTALGAGAWHIADDDEADVVSDELPVASIADTTADTTADAPTTALPVPETVDAADGASWSLADEAARTGEVFPGDTMDDPADDTAGHGDAGRTDAPVVDETPAPRDVDAPTTAFDAPVAAAATSAATPAPTPWWAEPESTVPPAVPPLVEPAAPAEHGSPEHLPPAVGPDFEALLGGHDDHDEWTPAPATDAAPVLPRSAPEDLDQSEWHGRETSDTSVIKDLFGTQAVDQLGSSGYDPNDTGTRMMPASAMPAHTPAAGRAPSAAGGPVGSTSDRGGLINDGFARLRGQGTRGKQLLFGGAIAIIVVMLVAVFLLTRWIIGNNIEEKTVPPTKSPAAASAQVSTEPSAGPSAPVTAAAAPTITFASSPAAPGQHPWYELAGGECLTPFDSAWAQEFTVVDCGTEHTAQLTARGTIEGDTFPGAEAVQTQAATQCQSAAGLDLTGAAKYGDVQVQGVYPPDQASWDQGDRFWSCFVTRSGGGALTGSLAPTA
ncbi:septum formation family protein [Curtobacterium sp. 9128]|uniref:septum formation family protein n=1 Tax=Curtobacterium sp. 9128 TaxID=1793722 RepID=UPI00119DA08A|nr:septum formation family protein [Curtobacterium sp. 9128]